MTPEQFIKIWQTVPEPQLIFYRLYYNDRGEPMFYTMEDLPGNYIEIDQDTYTRSPRNIRIQNGKIVYINRILTNKLVPAAHGSRCDSRDICVIIDHEPCINWSLKTYETD